MREFSYAGCGREQSFWVVSRAENFSGKPQKTRATKPKLTVSVESVAGSD